MFAESLEAGLAGRRLFLMPVGLPLEARALERSSERFMVRLSRLVVGKVEVLVGKLVGARRAVEDLGFVGAS